MRRGTEKKLRFDKKPVIMPNRVSSAVLCLVIAFAMAVGSLLPHAPHFPSHDPIDRAAAAARHAQLDAEIAAHGHSHDDGGEAERWGDFSHGHNPADHTHEAPITPPGGAPAGPALVRSWIPMPAHTGPIGATYRLERPPRRVVTG